MIRYDHLVGTPVSKVLIQRLMEEYNKKQIRGEKAAHFAFLKSDNEYVKRLNNLIKFVTDMDLCNVNHEYDFRCSNLGSMKIAEFDEIPNINFRNELLGIELYGRNKDGIGKWIAELQIKLIRGRLVHACQVGSFMFYNRKPERSDYEY